MNLRLSQLATLLEGELIGKDADFNHISTDTRSLTAGDLFFALQGPNFNAHDFVAAALAKGAVAAVVNRPVRSVSLPQIRVHNTKYALGTFAYMFMVI